MDTATSQQIIQMRALAGSIAHEMRNPLNACYGCVEILSGSMADSHGALD